MAQISEELISLMEDDKRFGREEALVTILPYSKRVLEYCKTHLLLAK